MKNLEKCLKFTNDQKCPNYLFLHQKLSVSFAPSSQSTPKWWNISDNIERFFIRKKKHDTLDISSLKKVLKYSD